MSAPTALFDLGPLTVERFIGRGGMAAVWSARHRASGTPVAIKVVVAELARAMRYRVAFAHEVRAVARLDHPAIVRVFDHGAVDDAAAAAGGLPPGAPFLVMERLDGGPLAPDRVADWPALAAILATLLDALAHAHARGVVHRDLKPDNVLFGPEGPVITDFGLAFDPARDRAVDGQATGTPGYMAPEQIRGEWRRFGPPTDLYALGCIAWELTCGTPPFAGPGRAPLAVAMAHLTDALPPLAPRFAVPPGFDRWLARLLERDPARRFASAAEARHALRAVVEGRPPGPLTVPADWRPGERPPRPAPLAGVGRALFGHRSWPAVGREADRDRLWRALHAVVSTGRPRLVLVEGPSGHGKTHLAEWLAERALRAGLARVLRATHEPIEPDGGPSGGPGPMLARFWRVMRDDVRHALPAIEALPALAGAPRHRALEMAALAAPDGICEDGGDRVKLDRAARDEVLLGALAALASAGPLVMVVDDAQWGAWSQGPLARLLDEGRLPILAILTIRSDAVARGGPVEARIDALRRRPDADALRLGPLDPEAHRRVIRAMLPVDDTLADALVERAAGSPLFAAELLRYFIGAGLLEDGPRGYRLAPGAEAALPRGIEAVWRARLTDALGAHAEAAWPALELAAALGLSVDGEEWTAACARAGIPWSRAGMERLLDARLMRITETGRWAFCHAMLRETLHASARAAGRWRALNAACAAALAEQPRTEPARLAEHLLAAGDFEAAVEPLRRAASTALLDGDAEQLARLQRRRITLLRRLRAPRGDPRWQSVRIHQARSDQRAGRYPRALRRAAQVEARAEAAGDLRHRVEALYVRANVVYYTRGPQRSMPLVEAALPLARQTGDPRLIEPLLSDFASTAMFLGRLDEAEAALIAAGRALEGLDLPRRRGTVLYYLANVDAFREASAAGIERCRAARAAFREAGSRHLQALTWSVEGDLERRRGALDRAAACYARFAADVRAVGPAERAYVALNGALLELARGRYAAARAGLDAAAAEGVSTPLAVIAAGHLACAAGLDDWLMWDATATELLAVLADAPLSPDVPWAADRAAALADAAGQPHRAALARRVAAEHRRRLRAPPSAA